MKHLVWLTPVIYFAISWAFPWDVIQWNSTVSISYLFDILFCISCLIIFKLQLSFGKQDLKGSISRAIAIVSIAVFTLFMTNLFVLPAPFKYIELLFLQILVLAPIVEELVFRYALFGALDKYFKNKNFLLLSNAILFSLSHAPAIFILPEEFHGFIYAQLVYTFFLGWICAKARLKTGSIVEPVLLHFVFNFIFYIAIIKRII
jgi:membrane protease YdiL (CAAX protease family)